jgi:hypothetical protein
LGGLLLSAGRQRGADPGQGGSVVNKTIALEMLRKVRSGNIPVEKLDKVIEWLECRKEPGPKKHTLEKKIQKFQETTDCIELVWAKMRALKSHPNYKLGIRRHNKLGIYDLAIKQVANDRGMKVTSLKKELPEYMFYLLQPDENVPSHMRRHVLKKRRQVTEMFRRNEEVIELYLENQLFRQKAQAIVDCGGDEGKLQTMFRTMFGK